jgi:hypothetical protein
MNTDTAKHAKILLQMLSHSLHGPWPLVPELDYPDTPKRSLASHSSPPRTSTIFPLRATRPRASTRPAHSAIRMQCLRLLKTEESLTASEASKMLQLDEELVQTQFSELHSLRLIEKGGVRKVDGQVRPVFHLNPTHPVLELLLGPTPGQD